MATKLFVKFVLVTVFIIALTFGALLGWARAGKDADVFLDDEEFFGEIVRAGIKASEGEFNGDFDPHTPVDYELTTWPSKSYKVTSDWMVEGGGVGSQDWLYTIRLSVHKTVTVKVFDESGEVEMVLEIYDSRQQYITTYDGNVRHGFFNNRPEFNEIIEQYELKDDVEDLAKITDERYRFRVSMKRGFTLPLWVP